MKPVRIGVVGCGAIAQVQHLPNLLELEEEFEVALVCDLSPSLARYAAGRFKVPRWTSELGQVLDADLDAVLLCHTDPKTEAAIAALGAGKHVLIEKPVCTSLQETEALVAAAERSGRVGLAAYMKIYDPAFELAQREVAAMGPIRFVQINHFHPDNRLHLGQFRVRHFADLPEGAARERREAYRARLQEAFGELFPQAEPACGITYGLIHDLYSLRAMLGSPSAVLSVQIWNNYRAITAVLEFPGGARCALSRVDLEELWDFEETLEVYSDAKRVLLSYPTGFSRRVLSKVVVQGTDERGTAFRKEPAIPWESAFTRELRHFHQCITQGAAPRSPLTGVRRDVELIIDITKAYLTRGPITRSA